MAPHPHRRLDRILSELAPSPASVGTLTLGNISYEVPRSLNPSRLAMSSHLLDIRDSATRDNLHFMLQKYILGQDVFLVSQPGPYARRLALTFAKYVHLLTLLKDFSQARGVRIINSEYEYIALHRDVGETELKQVRQ